MGFLQFTNSLKSILSNPHINRGVGVARHLHWQYLKAFNRFPFELDISRSRIIAAHKRCGVSALIYSQRLYNYNNMNLLQLLLKEGGSFLDIGANIGSFTLIASEQEKAKVHAFEPHPDTFRQLRNNVELNRRTNVDLYNIALGQSEGRIFLTNEPGITTNHIEPHESERTVSVPCNRVDTVCTQHGLHPQYVKIDVEGFEYDVLAGFGAFLNTVDLLMIEMNGLSDQRSHGQREIHSLLRSNRIDGPWRCDFDRKTLRRTEDSGIEDSLYLSDRAAGRLQQYGLTLAG
ncbi:MAG: FkbM family methyltransferase [Nitrospira sp.]|nr:FkbM family methyltransferase [Nitrospira sp.]